MARPPASWHLEDIKAALRRRHGSLRSLSIAWGYSRVGISMTLYDPRYSRPLERRIARELGVKPHVLWPARWAADGNSLPRDGDQRDITQTSRKSCQKKEAA